MSKFINIKTAAVKRNKPLQSMTKKQGRNRERNQETEAGGQHRDGKTTLFSLLVYILYR